MDCQFLWQGMEPGCRRAGPGRAGAPSPKGAAMSIPITEKLIQRQINHWNGLRKYLVSEQASTTPGHPPIITVSRQAGAGGRQLAEALCQRLDLQLHDRSLVERVMRQENLPAALVAEMDEQITSQSNLWIKGLFNRRIFLVKEYQSALTRTIGALADTVGGVFLGRGANHVLGDRADLRVRVVASFETRLANIQQRVGLSRTEARALLTETDESRGEFVAKVYGAVSGLPQDFDLVLNADRLGAEDLIETALTTLVNCCRGSDKIQVLSANVGGK